MNTSRFLLTALCTYIFVFAFEFLFHGMLMKEIYMMTAELWRAENEMKMPFMFASQISFSLVAAYIFTQNYEGKGLGEGLRFGFYIGMLLATIRLGSYSYMKVPLSLTCGWIAASLIKGLGTGVVCSLIYKRS